MIGDAILKRQQIRNPFVAFLINLMHKIDVRNQGINVVIRYIYAIYDEHSTFQVRLSRNGYE